HGEVPLDGDAAAGLVDEVEVLVEPDRDRGTHAEDQPVSRPALRLGQRAGTGVVDAGKLLPAPGEVPVQVDAVGVLAGAGGDAVGVEARNDPEVDSPGRVIVSSWRATAMPAGSSPWMQPTTRILWRPRGSPRSIARIGLPRTERPITIR